MPSYKPLRRIWNLSRRRILMTAY